MRNGLKIIGTELPRFLIAGSLSFGVTFVGLNGLLWLSVPLFLASFLAYGFGIVSSFLLNKKWTFSQRSFTKPLRRLFGEFLVFNVFMMFFFAQLNLWFVSWFGTSLVSQLMAIAVTTGLNFCMYRWVIFKSHT